MLESTWQEFVSKSSVDFGVRSIACGGSLQRLQRNSLAGELVRCRRRQRGEGGVARGR